MPYIQDHARYQLPDLDNMPADVWQEPEDTSPRTCVQDQERYLCIVGEEAYDYFGNFTACTYTAARSRGEHVPASADYLRDRCNPAPEDVAREIIADYMRFWASIEQDPDEADLLHDAANNIETR